VEETDEEETEKRKRWKRKIQKRRRQKGLLILGPEYHTTGLMYV